MIAYVSYRQETTKSIVETIMIRNTETGETWTVSMWIEIINFVEKRQWGVCRLFWCVEFVGIEIRNKNLVRLEETFNRPWFGQFNWPFDSLRHLPHAATILIFLTRLARKLTPVWDYFQQITSNTYFLTLVNLILSCIFSRWTHFIFILRLVRKGTEANNKDQWVSVVLSLAIAHIFFLLLLYFTAIVIICLNSHEVSTIILHKIIRQTAQRQTVNALTDKQRTFQFPMRQTQHR